MTSSAQTVVFLHGIGAGTDSWNAQIAGLPEGLTDIAPRMPDSPTPTVTGSL